MSDNQEKSTSKISYTEFCNRIGATPHIRFFLKKRFGKEMYSESTWKQKIK